MSENNHQWCVGCSPDNCSGCGGEPVGYVAHGSTMPRNIRVFEGCSILSKEEADKYIPECVTALYTTPQPDRTAELEAALKVARDALRYYGGDKYGTFANEAYAKINEVLKP